MHNNIIFVLFFSFYHFVDKPEHNFSNYVLLFCIFSVSSFSIFSFYAVAAATATGIYHTRCRFKSVNSVCHSIFSVDTNFLTLLRDFNTKCWQWAYSSRFFSFSFLPRPSMFLSCGFFSSSSLCYSVSSFDYFDRLFLVFSLSKWAIFPLKCYNSTYEQLFCRCLLFLSLFLPRSIHICDSLSLISFSAVMMMTTMILRVDFLLLPQYNFPFYSLFECESVHVVSASQAIISHFVVTIISPTAWVDITQNVSPLATCVWDAWALFS